MSEDLIKQKTDNFKKEGLVDAAARLGLEAEMYSSKNETKRAKECYQQASQCIYEQMAYYK